MLFRPFPKARDYVHVLKLRNREQWYEYCKFGKKPDDITARPDVAYKEEWISWGDWLGTGTVATFNREYWPFGKAREYVRSLRLKTWNEYKKWRKSRKKPDYIRAHPEVVYKNEFKNYSDWLGTDTTSTQHRQYWAFEKARESVHSLGFKNS